MSNKFCSPNNLNNTITCLSNDSLIKIGLFLISKYKSKIVVPKKPINQEARGKFWKNIQNELFVINEFSCQEDYCVLDDDDIKKVFEISESFRPPKPKSWYKNKETWLSTHDIKVVMEQYLSKHLDFEFIGPVPINFDEVLLPSFCVSNELCKISLRKMVKKGKYKLGMIFNLDTHRQSGSHWVALYADLNIGEIYYFDSYGNKPPDEIRELMKKLEHQGNELINKKLLTLNQAIRFNYENTTSDRKLCHIADKKLSKTHFNSFFNCNRFQFKNSECGVYSMHFIEEFLNNKSYSDIVNNIVKDDVINKKRDFYYRPNHK